MALPDRTSDASMSLVLRVVGRRVRTLLPPQASISSVRNFCKEDEKKLPASLQQKFVPFDDRDSGVIRDFHEEQYDMQWEEKHREVDDESFYLYREKKTPVQRALNLPLERGVHGVFDIEDLVQALRSEKLAEISVIRVPEHAHYCDYLVMATTKSRKHMNAVIQLIRKLYKLKKRETDKHLEQAVGERTDSNWRIIDMGYIVLHLFEPGVRDVYDLESLWCVGSEFDENTVRPKYDAVIDFMDKQIKFMEQLQPLTEPTPHQT